MFKNQSTECKRNACFYGFAIDLLARLATELKFTYTLYEAPDGKYGAMNEYTRQWDGMVRELIPDKRGLTVSTVTTRIKAHVFVQKIHSCDLGAGPFQFSGI